MSYSTAQKVTPIEMLPDLEELEKGNFSIDHQGGSYSTATYPGAVMLPPSDVEKFGRYIRGMHAMPHESGMTPYNQYHQAPQSQQILSPSYGTNIDEYDEKDTNKVTSSKPKYTLPDDSPSCIDVANHLASCPICSRYYNNDKTIYIIAIIVLAVVCILLLKKVIDI